MADSTKEVLINVPVLARVEGEGALELHIKDENIESLRLKIFEPPRLFEKFLQGRSHQQVIDMVARICGICPVAYQMSAVHAIENAFTVPEPVYVKQLRRMFMCGEWIESHALHIHLLAAPDFLGASNAIELAQRFPDQVKRGLRLQALGNRLIKLFGGRSVHPVGVCVGGFFREPDANELILLRAELRHALDDAEQLVRWVAQLTLPNDDQEFISVCLHSDEQYAMNDGRIIATDGLDIDISRYEDYFTEFQAEYSTAKHAHYQGKPYLVGPLARLNNNWQQLHTRQLRLLAEIGLSLPSHNMFHSIIARAIEIDYALDEAIKMIDELVVRGDRPQVKQINDVLMNTETVTGIGACEAPRGILWHKYLFDDRGHVLEANIIPPTSQNQARIEQDLAWSLQQFGLSQSDDQIRHHAETVIRNYDPCISCATHFLQVKTHRE